MKRKPQPPAPWFRLRCAACACLAAGVWISVFAATSSGNQAAQAATVAAADRAGDQSLPPGTVRPAIIIDPGHGGKQPGKVAGDQLEKTWTLQFGLTLAEELRHRGLAVELTRTEDVTMTPEDRSALANRAPPGAAFVSIHFNSGPPEASGIEVFYAWPKSPPAMVRLDADHRLPAGMTVCDDRGRLLAETLQTAACEATGARNRGVKNNPSYAVLNRTLCPAVLIECGFLTNAEECRNIQSEEWRKKLATSLADGLEKWLLTTADAPGYGITYEPAAKTSDTAAAVLHTAAPADQ